MNHHSEENSEDPLPKNESQPSASQPGNGSKALPLSEADSEISETDERFLRRLRQLNLPAVATTDNLAGPLQTDHVRVNHSWQPSPMIGPYKLLQKIGVGGMGDVWMAEQEKPVRRRVALKLIKANLDSRQIIARFEAEQQALAMMDHQNIAKVLDAGTTPDGRPYFAMELVQGIPITKYCDANKLSIEDRLKLFIPICKAIQHAHHKGIIHRDLKPSNILVTLYDGTPVAKVIDFGLAKALQHQSKLTEKTLFTEFGQVVGTLQYMSPEQAEMNALDVDTRTDIYALGVLLYELLTGSTPIDKKMLEEHAILKVLETIRETDPPRPSIRLSSSGAALVGISQQRQIDPKKLTEILRGDLDWIVMKSLEKDRTRRYDTAIEFAEDISRYLNGEAIEARPPSFAYKSQKFARKHRSLVYWTLSAFALLLLTTLVSTSFGVTANLAKQKAKASEQQAIIERQKAIEAEQAAEVARQSAEQDAIRALKAEKAAQEESQAAQQARSETEKALAHTKVTLAHSRFNQNRVGDALLILDEVPLASRDMVWQTARSFYDESLLTLYHLDRNGTPSAVASIELTEDGKQVYTMGSTGYSIWDTSDWRHLSTKHKSLMSLDSQWITDPHLDRFCELHMGFCQIFAKDLTPQREIPLIDGRINTCADFIDAGTRIAFISAERTLVLHDVNTGELVGSTPFNGHNNLQFTSFKYNPQSNEIIVGTSNHGLIIFDSSTLEQKRFLSGQLGSVNQIAISPNGIIVASASDKQLVIWNMASGKPRHTIPLGEGRVNRLRFSPDGSYLASASSDAVIELWHVASGERIRCFRGHQAPVNGLTFTTDGSLLVSGSSDGAIKLWDVRSRTPVSSGENSDAKASIFSEIQFSQDGKRMVTRNAVGTLRVWDCSNQHSIVELSRTHEACSTFALSPDGNKIVVADGNSIGLLSVENCNMKVSVSAGKDIKNLAFSIDGTMVVSRDNNGRVQFRSSNTLKPQLIDFKVKDLFSQAGGSSTRQLTNVLHFDLGWNECLLPFDNESFALVRDPSQYDSLYDACYFPNHRKICMVYYKENLHGVNWLTLDNSKTGLVHERQLPRAVAIHPTEPISLILTSSGQQVLLIDLSSGRELLRFEIDPCRSITFHPDGNGFICTDNDGLPTFRRLSNLTQSTVLQEDFIEDSIGPAFGWVSPSRQVRPILSPKARWLAALDYHEIQLWNTLEGIKIDTTSLNSKIVTDLAFSSQDSFLALGRIDGSVDFYSLPTLELKLSFQVDELPVERLAFAPDDQVLISISSTGIIEAWDSTQGTKLWKVPKLEPIVENIAISADGKGLLIETLASELVDAVLSENENGEFSYIDRITGTELETVTNKYSVDLATGNTQELSALPQGGKKLFASSAPVSLQSTSHGTRLVGPGQEMLRQAVKQSYSQIDAYWHELQTQQAFADHDWYAAVFHSAWQKQADPTSALIEYRFRHAMQHWYSENPFASTNPIPNRMVQQLIDQSIESSQLKIDDWSAVAEVLERCCTAGEISTTNIGELELHLAHLLCQQHGHLRCYNVLAELYFQAGNFADCFRTLHKGYVTNGASKSAWLHFKLHELVHAYTQRLRSHSNDEIRGWIGDELLGVLTSQPANMVSEQDASEIWRKAWQVIADSNDRNNSFYISNPISPIDSSEKVEANFENQRKFVELLRLAVDQHPTGPLICTFGAYLLKLGNYEHAKNMLLRSLPLNEVQLTAKPVASALDSALLAICYKRLGDLEQAEPFRKAVYDSANVAAAEWRYREIGGLGQFPNELLRLLETEFRKITPVRPSIISQPSP